MGHLLCEALLCGGRGSRYTKPPQGEAELGSKRTRGEFANHSHATVLIVRSEAMAWRRQLESAYTKGGRPKQELGASRPIGGSGRCG